MKSKALVLLFAGTLCAFASVVPGGPPPAYYTSYTVTLDAGWPNVTNILMLENGDGFGSGTWAFQANGDPDVPTVTVLSNPFSHPGPVENALLIGLAQDFPHDAPGQEHVVLMMNPTAAALAADIAWGTLFPHTLEDDLIGAIQLATSGQDWSIIQPGLDAISAFADGDATTGILDHGFPVSAFFTPGNPFTVMAWSDGTQIGTGTSQDILATPEPATLSGMVLAAAMFAVVRRRRRA